MYGSKVKTSLFPQIPSYPGGGTFIDKSAISNEARCQKPSNLLRRRIKGATLHDLWPTTFIHGPFALQDDKGELF